MPRILLPGRYQPVHHGHVHLLTFARSFSKVVIGIRDTKVSARNPWSMEERRRQWVLTLKTVDDPEIEITSIPDINGIAWPSEILRLSHCDFAMTGNKQILDLFLEADCPVLWAPRKPGHSGTAVRQAMAAGKPLVDLVPW